MQKSSFVNNTFKDSIIIFMIKALGAGMSFFFSFIIAKKYDASGIGLYSLAISVFNILLMISKFGMENALIKYVSILKKENNGNAIKNIKKSSVKLTLGISLSCVLLCIIASGFICDVIFSKSNLRSILLVVIWTTVPYALSKIYISFIKGMGSIKIAMFLDSALMPILDIVMIIVVIFCLNNDEYLIIGFVHVISAIIVMISSIIIYRDNVKKISYSNNEKFDFKNVIQTARPLFWVTSTNYLLGSTDTLMLGVMKDEAEVGIYNISAKVTKFPSMILVAVNAVLGPKFSVLYHEGKMAELKKLLQQSSRLMLIVAIGICSMFILCAKWIVLLLGESFAGAEVIIYIVSIGQFFLLATGPVATLLMMTGYEKLHRNNTLGCAILNIILNVFLIYYMGAFGAALATTISLIVKNVVGVILVYKKLGMFIYF